MKQIKNNLIEKRKLDLGKTIKVDSDFNIKKYLFQIQKKIKLGNINISNLSTKNSSAGLNDNMPYNTEPFDSKYSFKINKIKDDYIDFLQKEFEDKAEKLRNTTMKLDNNKKLKFYGLYKVATVGKYSEKNKL